MIFSPARIRLTISALAFIGTLTLMQAEPTITVKDAAGEKIALKSAKWTTGTRKLAWLADPKATTVEGKAGPLAIEFRETQSTTFVDGVLTLTPVSAITSIQYEATKQTVTLTVAGITDPLTGSTVFRGVNQFGIDAEVDKGTAGVAVVKYRGGIPNTGIKSIELTDAKAVKHEMAKKKFSVTLNDVKAKNPVVTVDDLMPLYRLPDGKELLVGTLPFEKTLKQPWVDVQTVKLEVPMEKNKPNEWVLTTTDGKSQTLVPMKTLEIEGKKATLIGLVGNVPAGYKLFPLHTIKELTIAKE